MANPSQSRLENVDLFVGGNLSCRTFTPPDASITDDAIEGNAGILYTKMQQKVLARHVQVAGSAVAAKTEVIHIADANGSLLTLKATLVTPPTSTDTVTIDLKKGNTATAFASVLTATLGFDNTKTARTVYSASITTADYLAGDVFEIVVTVSGTSAQGLCVTLAAAEAPQ